MKTLAAIDVGSNAIRFVVAMIGDDRRLRLIKTLRAPVRLGRDVFKTGFIEKGTAKEAVAAFLQFKKNITKYKVRYVKAVATSATREAANRREFVEFVALKSGIHLCLVNGDDEALLIHRMLAEHFRFQGKRSLIMDIGGGSVELVFANSGQLRLVRSFPLGTVRLLNDLKNVEPAQQVEQLEKWVHRAAPQFRRAVQDAGFDRPVNMFIGTGGNIEALGRLRKTLLRRKETNFLEASELNSLIQKLESLSYRERVQKLELRKDRADVIVPAAVVLREVMAMARARRVLIPGLGLKDAILADMKRVLEGSGPGIGCSCWSHLS